MNKDLGVAEVSQAYLIEAAERAVPIGYKQTEAGVIPEDWGTVRLGERASFIGSGKTNTKIVGNYPLYGSTGQIGCCLSPEYEGDSILVARVGANAGQLNFVNGQYGVSDNTIIVRLKVNNLIHYFKYWLIRKNLNTLVFGSGQPLITGSQLKELLIPLPSNVEQTAIANALSDVDALLRELEKLIAKRQAIKTATMQQLLTGRTRLPQFALRKDGSPKGYKQSELGEVPEDWKVTNVGDECDLLTGFPFPSNSYASAGIRLLRGSNVKRGHTDWGNSITQYWAETSVDIKRYELQFGDIVISMDGSLVGRSFAQLSKHDVPALLLQRVARLRGRTVSQDYLKEWVCSAFFTEYCDSIKTVTAIPHISPQDIRNFIFLLPLETEEQIAIATILSNMDEETQALEQRLSKTRQIKKGMMQELLTGRTRLLHPSAVVAGHSH